MSAFHYLRAGLSIRAMGTGVSTIALVIRIHLMFYVVESCD